MGENGVPAAGVGVARGVDGGGGSIQEEEGERGLLYIGKRG